MGLILVFDGAHAFITDVSKSIITIADRDEMLFGFLESARTDICLMFLSVQGGRPLMRLGFF